MSTKAFLCIVGVLAVSIAVPTAAQVNSKEFHERLERSARLDTADALEEIAAQLQYQNLVKQQYANLDRWQTLQLSAPKPAPTAVDMEIHGGYVGILWSDGRIVRQRWADTPMQTP